MRRLVLALGALLASGVVLAGLWAGRPDRAVVTSTSPADGAVLAQAPTDVVLSLNGPVDLGRSHVSVRDRAGTAVTSGQPGLVTPERLRQPVSIPATGEMTVAYHVTFMDGAELVGRLRFSVAGQAGSAAVPAPASAGTEPAHAHGVDPFSAVLLVLDGIVALTVVVLLLRRPRLPGPPAHRP
ncbi:MAG TPA: copper resistance CopC family protein [Micromonosporaceae bacterium]|nr:copper resistance CopC family protein [Micromonosporaceae bacterium]